MNNEKVKVIGIGGYARAGKDLFADVSSNILKQRGYKPRHLSFAKALKKEVQQMFDANGWDLDIWETDTEKKKRFRSLLVWWGCMRREMGTGRYWVDQVDSQISMEATLMTPEDLKSTVYLISDVRFPNESKWVHEKKWDGWFVHLKKYSLEPMWGGENRGYIKEFDQAPNEEEAKQDPLIQLEADYKLELENIIEREKRNRNFITTKDLPTNSYLVESVTNTLKQCPFLTFPKS